MRHKASVTVGGLALIGAGVAYAVPDSCDIGGGPLEGDVLHRDLAYSDAFFVPDAAQDEFGTAIVTGDFDGDGRMDVAIGAPGADPNGNQSGAVYVYLTSNDSGTLPDVTTSLWADVILYGEKRGDHTGYALGNAGDIDNDGRDDLLIGSLASNDLGIAHVVTGATLSAATGAQVTLDLFQDADYRIVGPLTGSEFGSALNGVGDINNDGTDDFIIGAPMYSGVSNQRGAAYVFYGGGFPSQTVYAASAAAARIDGALNQSSFGAVIEPAGDVDDDGFADFWIGAPRDNTAGSTAGAAYMFSGATAISNVVTAGPDTATVILYGRAGYRCGSAIAFAPDLNGDGIEDAFIGCKQAGTFKKGAVYIMRGGPEGQAPIDILGGWNGWGQSANTLAGSAIKVGDFNKDGWYDVAIGGERGPGAVLSAGVTYVVHGPFDFISNDQVNLNEAADFVVRGSADSEFIGASLAVGDYDGDGIDDLFVGAPKSQAHLLYAGAVAYYRGGSDISDLVPWYADADNDGYGDPNNSIMDCDNAAPVGYVRNATDCDDSQNTIYPGALEYCGTDIDMNCDGLTWNGNDEDLDLDGDGFPSCMTGAGVEVDCNDGLAEIHPGAPERCNGIDDDCDGLIDDQDDNVVDAGAYYVDVDGDGYGFPIPIIACTEPNLEVPVVTNGDDCNDQNAMINPAAPEVCGDGIDNDCVNGVDDGGAVDARVFWADVDGDGYGNPKSSIRACVQPSGYVQNRSDCDDTTGTIRPGAVETCDAVDNDCDGMYYMGGQSETAARAHASFLGEAAGDRLVAAGFLPDQDFDGRDELIMVSPKNDVGAPEGGAVYIKRGEVPGGTFLLGDRRANGDYWFDTRIVGTRNNAEFGSDIAVGDFNGDGIADLAVGAPGARAPDLNQGAVYVFFGPIPDGNLVAEDAHIILRGEKGGERFGYSVTLGDIDGDGYDDLIASARSHNTFTPSQGKLYVVYGGPSLAGNHRIDTVASGWFLGASNGEEVGSQITTLDFNGDGLLDIAVGAEKSRVEGLGRGRVYFFPGSTTRYANAAEMVPEWIVYGNGNNANLGRGVSNIGDVNGDGFDDLYIGATTGRGFLLLGRDEPLPSAPVTIGSVVDIAFTHQTLTNTGEYARGIGDVNQDGFPDFVISSPGDDKNGTNAGAGFLIYGRASFASMVSPGGDFDLGKLESYGRIDPVQLLPDGTPLVHSAVNYNTLEGARIMGVNAGDNLGGESVASDLLVGDYDGDGVPDYALSAPEARLNDNNLNVGRVHLFLGGRYGIDVFVADGSYETWYWDWDADQWTTDETFEACMIHRPVEFRPGQNPAFVPRGLAVQSNPLDCNDRDPRVHPGASETQGDGEDTDCDGYDNPNILPIVSVVITPDPAKATDTLVATPTVINHDTDGIDPSDFIHEYRWYVNGQLIAGVVGPILAPTHFKASDSVKVEFRVDDRRGVTDWVSDTITIENTPPTLESCSITPAAPLASDGLTAVAAGLHDDDVPDQENLSVRYEWRIQQPGWSTYQPIPNETGSTLASCNDRFDPLNNSFNCVVGTRIKVLCTAVDSSGDGQTLESAPITIQNTPPSVTSCVVGPAGARTNNDLTVVATGADEDFGSSVSFTYRWFRNGELIEGETGSTLSAVYTLHFDQIQAECTPHDPEGAVGTPVRSAPLVIANTPPSGFAAQLHPMPTLSTDALSVTITSHATDADEVDTITYHYEWTRNGQPFPNPTPVTTTSSVPATATTKGDRWQVTVRAWDGYAYGPSLTLETDILNSPPSIASAVIVPNDTTTTPESRQTLTALATGYFDPDGDPPQNKYQWWVNNTPVPAVQGGTLPTLSPQHFERGSAVFVVITPFDGDLEGNPPRTSTVVYIKNSPPEAPVLNPLTPNPAGYDDDLWCSIAIPSTDYDDDPISYTVEWWRFRPDDPFSNPNGAGTYERVRFKEGVTSFFDEIWELPRGDTAYADRFSCRVTPNDGSVNGPTAQTPELAIQDLEKPGAPVVEIIEPYRNSNTFRLKGECKGSPIECYKLHYECWDGTPNPVPGQNLITGVGGEDELTGCVGDEQSPLWGTFDFVASFPQPGGRTWSCRMWCEDIGSNISLDSNVLTTTVCDPADVYDLANVGNSFEDAVDRNPGDSQAWPTMLDETGATRVLVGNIIGRSNINEVGQTDDTYDWYLIRTQDNKANDEIDQRNDYNFQVAFLVGEDKYDFQVYRYTGAETLPGTLQCPLTGTYDEYNYYNSDNWEHDKNNLPYSLIWHQHHHPFTSYGADGNPNGAVQEITDRQRCKAHPQPVSPPEAIYNDCNDMTANYYIRVNRVQPNSEWDCSHYEIEVSMD